jgi:hypothetical protein
MKFQWYLVILLAGCSSQASNSSGGTKGTTGNPFGNSGTGGTGSSPGSDGGPVIVRTDGVGDACTEQGAMRVCCETGHQTCTGTAEFKQWGPCLGANGKQVTCTGTGGPSDCSSMEFSQFCDAGPPPKTSCEDNEFGCGNDGGTPPMPALCSDESVNNEPEILVGYSPAMGESVAQDGQIKVWVNDERPEIIAGNEQIDAMTGMIITPGDRTVKAADGYLWEPALYIAPQTAESGGTPHFPQFIKGWYNNMPPANGGARGGGRTPVMGTQVPGMDPVPPGMKLSEKYSTEIIWDVQALGLPPGTYIGEFVIHDGDRDRAIGCVTITITG